MTAMLNPQLKKFLQEVLLVDDINYEDSMETVDLWDSMQHMELMLGLEQKYHLVLEPEEIIQLTSVKAIQQFLEIRGLL